MNKLAALFTVVLAACVPPATTATGNTEDASVTYRLTPRDKQGIESELRFQIIQVSFGASSLDTQQSQNLLEILEAAAAYGYDPYVLVSIAFVESSFRTGAVSSTGDIGIFQINYRWWGKELGYRDYEDFAIRNKNIHRNARHAIEILRRFAAHRSCTGDNLFACYNGGYGWRRSEKRRQIEHYRDKVLETKRVLERDYPQWEADQSRD